MSLGYLQGGGRRVVRGQINPLDVCTIVSIYPKKIREVKVTLQPGVFIIEAGSYAQPALLRVEPSSWWKDLDIEQPLLEITNSSIQVANSIIQDYCNGLLACDMGDVMPGLFYVTGSKSVKDIREKHQDLLDNAARKQKNLFAELIKMADVLWARTNRNPLAITNDMRLAAQELGVKAKDWMQDFNTRCYVPCPACGSMRDDNFPVCSNCKTIVDKKKYKEQGLEMAL